MSNFWTKEGEPTTLLVDESGDLFFCDECPCGLTLVCAVGWPETLTLSIAGADGLDGQTYESTIFFPSGPFTYCGVNPAFGANCTWQSGAIGALGYWVGDCNYNGDWAVGVGRISGGDWVVGLVVAERSGSDSEVVYLKNLGASMPSISDLPITFTDSDICHTLNTTMEGCVANGTWTVSY